MIPLAGCSIVLGIEDPSTGSRIDAAVDATEPPIGDHLMFSLGDFNLAKQQTVRFHVQLVHVDGRMEDVSATATLSTDNDTIATIGPMIGAAATVNSGSQDGVATISATLTGAAPATVKANVTMIQCHPVINELTTASSALGAADEWVEVYNPCTMPIDVTGWTLNYRGANVIATMPDSNLMVTLTGQMMPGELRLFGGPDYAGTKDGMWSNVSGILGGNNGAVGLRSGAMSVGVIVDAVGYGTAVSGNPFRESTSAPAMSVDVSASRAPFDGKDDNNGMMDFKITPTPTPRALNVP